MNEQSLAERRCRVTVDVELLGFLMAAIKTLGESCLRAPGLSADAYSELHAMLEDLNRQMARCDNECVEPLPLPAPTESGDE